MRFGLIVLSLGMGLLLAEAATRLFCLAPDIYRFRPGIAESAYELSADPLLGYVLKKNYRHPHPDFIETFPFTNSDGFRDHERSRRKPTGAFRIILLGDSVVIGERLPSLRDTISDHLETLYAHAKRRVEVLNVGVSGYCSLAEVELLRKKGLAYQPDAVVVLFVENDYQNFNGKMWQQRWPRPPGTETLFLNCSLFRWVCLSRDWFHFREQAEPDDLIRWHGGALGPNNVDAALRDLKTLSHQYGFKTLIVLWPRFGRDRIGYVFPWSHRWAEDNDSLPVERMALERGLETVRMDEFFRRDLQRRAGSHLPCQVYTAGDTMHPSREGAQTAAHVLKTILDARWGLSL